VEAFVQAEVWRLVAFAFVILAVAIPVQREIRLSPDRLAFVFHRAVLHEIDLHSRRRHIIDRFT